MATAPRGSWADEASHFKECLEHPWYTTIFRLSSCIVSEATRYFEALGYCAALAPVTAQSISSPMGLGSDSKPVQITLFDRSVYLADSMQFHLEYLLRIQKKGVFYIMPTFRGEEADRRHLNEFFHIEAELVGGLNDAMSVVEGLLVALVNRILKDFPTEVSKCAEGIDHLQRFLRNQPIKRIRFDSVATVLPIASELFTSVDGKSIGLSSKGEQTLMKTIGEPLWITHLPRLGVPFYQADESDASCLCADLLLGIGEVVGCGQRHATYSDTRRGMQARSIEMQNYNWYLRLKKEYPLKTSGFGIGLERLLLWILRHDDIRDVQLFVRQRGKYGIP